MSFPNYCVAIIIFTTLWSSCQRPLEGGFVDFLCVHMVVIMSQQIDWNLQTQIQQSDTPSLLNPTLPLSFLKATALNGAWDRIVL